MRVVAHPPVENLTSPKVLTSYHLIRTVDTKRFKRPNPFSTASARAITVQPFLGAAAPIGRSIAVKSGEGRQYHLFSRVPTFSVLLTATWPNQTASLRRSPDMIG